MTSLFVFLTVETTVQAAYLLLSQVQSCQLGGRAIKSVRIEGLVWPEGLKRTERGEGFSCSCCAP